MTINGWVFPPAESADEYGIVGVGADLEPETILAGYSQGLFPMPLEPNGRLAWWSPDPRAIMPLDMHISRSLARSMRKFNFTINQSFTEVMEACADPSRPHGWIDSQVLAAYNQLHQLGWAHSVECWNDAGDLVGGVYGVGVGAMFAGESMFHRETDASKAALVHLTQNLSENGIELFDVQWMTPHLKSLGAIDLPRSEYLRRLKDALRSEPDT